MKGRIALMTVLLVTLVWVVFHGCGKKEEKAPAPKTEAQEEAKQRFIAYETLRRWTPQGGGVGMIILVSEETTKEEVLALARHLRSEYLSMGWVWIDIFDSKEAYLHRDNPNYPEEKYSKHWLVNVVRNPKTGHDKINWVAEGRDH